ncbi:MAG: hypothetical protein JWO36_4190 [Myxococcales bacterium]|nr:hypothetical protein [Myxococcales bacterium]
MAIVLSAIKKGAHTIRMNKDPLIVFFDIGDRTIEEIRPPELIRERLVDELKKLAEMQPDDHTGFFVLELADGTSHRLQIELGDGFQVFRIKLEAVELLH